MNAQQPSNPDAQVYRTNIDSTSAIFNTNAVYQKAAWVMHMLRHLLGDDAFFAALADYRAAFHSDSATTRSSPLSSPRARPGPRLVHRPVGDESREPRLRLELRSRAHRRSRLLKLAIWQRQHLAGYDLLGMPIDIRVTTASGSSIHSVWNNAGASTM